MFLLTEVFSPGSHAGYFLCVPSGLTRVSFSPVIGTTVLASIRRSDNSDTSMSWRSAGFFSTKSLYISVLLDSNCCYTCSSEAPGLNSGVFSTVGDITNSSPSSLTFGSSFTSGVSSWVVYDRSNLSRALEY